MPGTRERFSRLILTRTLCGEFVGLGPEGGTEKKELAEGRTAHAQYRWQSQALNRPPGSRVHTKHRPPGPPACPASLPGPPGKAAGQAAAGKGTGRRRAPAGDTQGLTVTGRRP